MIQLDGLPDDALVDKRGRDTLFPAKSEMCFWRWTRAGKFPPPDRVINGRKYWRLGTLRAAARGEWVPEAA